MKSAGMIRKLDPVGRIVIPRELLKTMEIKSGDPVEIFTDDNQIILKKYEPGCLLCGDLHAVKKVGNRLICKECLKMLQEEL
ncbi:AbrB/MazE/SpoVT family DNA-binding domain-containing protein [Clostridiales Family XIII bacterium ASD5510]|uniref:AbrB/MazE/SpoVT family DNA-binding domain-containing protein n=1 Tax=Hominibacterium faecale TaxID=2839743 RepID=A0A9J6QYD1_9FIRM|nr:AbrB/MazE/SpoVT family DNA-binding domain-containing protein [Hominibacterium faecale]MCU7380474.1 AbrB/MazE/SpoVT family DNA-binding domain-containing protein [Hominibacterium faecale]